jgi:uncharacterized membrane protein
MNFLDLVLLGAVITLWVRLSRQSTRVQRMETELALLDEQRRRHEAAVQYAARREASPEVLSGSAAEAAADAEKLSTPRPTPTPEVVPIPEEGPWRVPGEGQGTPPPLLVPPVSAFPISKPLEPATPAAAPAWSVPEINWERFLGVKLFAWLGGLALFLAAAFFLKYSFDHDLIPPAMRVVIGYVTAIGLVLGGLRLWRREYDVLSATLVGTGVVILYAVTFACRALYHFPFFGVVPTFLLMMLITVAAFLLAIRMDLQVVAILGLLGGFLTPVLISTGVDNPVGLFGYITILDLGLFAVIWNRRWRPLAVLGAVATIAIQVGWMSRFYTVDRLVVLQVVQPWFVALFAGFFVVMERGGRGDRSVLTAFLLPAAFALLCGVGLAASGAGNYPIRLFVLWLAVDVVVLAAAFNVKGVRWIEPLVGSWVFLLLVIWTSLHTSEENLMASLGAYFAFALLHTAVPMIRLRLYPDEKPGLESQLFPAVALVLFLLPVLRDTGVLPGVFWVGMLGIIVLALMLAALAGAFLAAGAVLVVSLAVAAAAFVRSGPIAMTWSDSMVVVAGFAAVFVAGGWWLARRRLPMLPGGVTGFGLPSMANNPQLAIAGSGAVLPFLLLTLLASRAAETHLHSLFGMTVLLVVLVLGLARATGFHLLAAFGLVGVGLVEAAWYARGFGGTNLGSTVGWQLVLYGLFTGYPFLVDRAKPGCQPAWITAAAAAPLQFLWLYLTVRRGEPMGVPGLIPAAFAVPALAVLAWLARRWAAEDVRRLGTLSVQGGVALLFITLVFPIQFSREWLTVAWAVEGAALIWLFQRLPHPGLRYTGLALLGIAFVRLVLNPAILEYHPRSGTRIWNWYLYAYLVGAAAQFVGARLLRPPAHLLGKTDVRGVLQALGVILLFALMNLEIADYFAEGPTLTFEFTGHFARDLSYTIGWGLFALALLIGGILKSSRPTRFAGLGLLSVTLAKLFLHDLARLDQLYRIGAFAGVAVIAIVASFLYQRFLNRPEPHS